MTVYILFITLIIIVLLYFAPHIRHVSSNIDKNIQLFYDNTYDNIYIPQNKINKTKKYIHDIVLNNHDKLIVTDKTKSKFTRSKIDKYRESQLQFRENIYGTSAPYMDQVDKMNLAQNIKATGGTVADYHDNINKIEI